MKQLILFALCLLIIACQDPFLIGNEYTQSELISTISKGRKCVWIGSETGAIFAFDPETERFTSPQWIETERIYAITEVADSLLLVGIRNEGLKLITFDQGILKTIKSYQIEKGDLLFALLIYCKARSCGNRHFTMCLIQRIILYRFFTK